MRTTNSYKRVTLILIFMLFIFQNAWAIEQTYLMICQNFETKQEQSQLENEKHTEVHDDEQCADCCHLNTSLVTVLQTNFSNHLLTNNHYSHSAFNQFYSIFIQPPLPPPIV